MLREFCQVTDSRSIFVYQVCKKSCHLQELPLAVPYGWFGKWQVLCIVRCEEIFLSTLRDKALCPSTMSPMEIRFNSITQQ